jgi:lipoprotein-releasing system permease protein
MSVEFTIATKYLRTKRRKGFLSFISSVSMIGLVLAMITLITVLSVMNGFQQDIRENVLSSISHAYIADFNGDIKNHKQVRAKIDKNPHLLASSPYIDKYGLLTSFRQAQGVSVRGIFPEQEKKVSNIINKIKEGTSKLGKNDILIGLGLAKLLGVALGDKVTLLTPKLTTSILGSTPKLKRFKIVGLFDIGIKEYDNSLAFIHFDMAKKLYKTKGASGIRLKFDNLFNSEVILTQLMQKISQDYYAVDWKQQKRNLFRSLQLEKQLMSLVLLLIIMVAAFNIVSMMVMVVNDKRSAIAILRTMGMTPRSITKIFFYQGLMIGLIGIFFGAVLGIILSLNLSEVVHFFEVLFGFEFFPADVFYFNRFPSQLQFNDIITVISTAFVLVLLATIYPAINAGKVNISQTLRYE